MSEEDVPNPFLIGQPVDGDEFFGRHPQLEEVLRLLEQGSAVNIFSLRRIGKTSMRHQIAYLCAHDPQWRHLKPLSIDLSMFGSETALRELAWYVARQLGIRVSPSNSLNAWSEVRDRLYDATGETLVLLDEAEILARVPDAGSLGTLRALQQEGILGLVFFTAYYSLSEIFLSAESTNVIGSPLWNVFFPLQLPAFAPTEAEALLTTQFKRAGHVMSTDLAQQLAAYVGGYPQLVQEVGYAAHDHCVESRLTGVDGRHFGRVIDRWRHRIAPWWTEMFLHAVEAISRAAGSRQGAERCIEDLISYGIVNRGAAGNLEVAAFIDDLTAHARGRALKSVIKEVFNGQAHYPATSTSDDTVMSAQVEVFFSYSHKDEALRDELAAHLKLLERTNVIRSWHDRRIGAGDEWRQVIHDQLENAAIILLLVSSDFLASDYCYDVEMRRALTRHAAGEVAVIPIILRDCKWDRAPFAKLQALPKNGKPITSWTNPDEAWTNVAAGIEVAVARVTSIWRGRFHHEQHL